MVSFVPKVRRAVFLISLMHHSAQTDVQTDKPNIIVFYNSTDGEIRCTRPKMCIVQHKQKNKGMANCNLLRYLEYFNCEWFCFGLLVSRRLKKKHVVSLSRISVMHWWYRIWEGGILPRELRRLIGGILSEAVSGRKQEEMWAVSCRTVQWLWKWSVEKTPYLY